MRRRHAEAVKKCNQAVHRSHLCCRQQSLRTIWRRSGSCGGNCGRRPAQAVDQIDDANKHLPRQRGLGHLEDDIAGMAHQSGAGLDQPLAQRGQRPCLYDLGRRVMNLLNIDANTNLGGNQAFTFSGYTPTFSGAAGRAVQR